jgi:hypothetical protein
MNRINSDVLNEIISYLKLPEIKKLGICSGYNYEICKKMVPYSYSQHGDSEYYVKMNNIKWMIDDCDGNRLNNAIVKQLDICDIHFHEDFNQSIKAIANCTNLQQIKFGVEFNQPVEALANCTNLQQITFGVKFNQPIEAIANCTNLQQITFGGCFNQPVETFCFNLPSCKIIRYD